MSTAGAKKHLTELNERQKGESSDQPEQPDAGLAAAAETTSGGGSDGSLKADTRSDHLRHSTYDDDAPLTENDFYLRVKDYAPNSELGESVLLDPDITLFCEGCKRYINISDLKSHGKFHDALHTFHYSDQDRPDNLTDLNVCRRNLLKESYRNLKNSGELPNPAIFRELDDAYEIIKADLENNTRRPFGPSHPVVCGTSSKPSASSCIEAVGLCSAVNKQWKNEMEEAKVFQDCFGGDPRKCFIGLYSGYNGSNAAKTSSKVLHTYLLSEIEKQSSSFHTDIAKESNDGLRERDELGQSGTSQNPEINCDNSESNIHEEDVQDVHSDLGHRFALAMAAASTKAHHSVDEILSSGEGESSRVRWSGCSTLTCLIDCYEEVHTQVLKVSEGAENQGGCETTASETQNVNNPAESEIQEESHSRHLATIHISNAGDVQAVLVRRNKPILLTKMHLMSNKYEHHRISQAGGTITKTGKEYRLNGISTATRGLGNHGDPLLKSFVISRPYAASIPVDDSCQFLILASNGVWQVLSHNEVAVLLLQMLPCHFIPPPSALSSTVDVLLYGEQKKSKMSILSGDVFEDYDTTVTLNGNSQTELSSKVHTNSSLESVHKHANSLPTAVSRGSDRKGEYKGDLVSAERDSLTEDRSDAQKTEKPSDIRSKSSGSKGSVSLHLNVSTPRLTSETIVNKEEECLGLSRCMSERLVQAALMAGSKGNVTAIVVLFSGRNGVYF